MKARPLVFALAAGLLLGCGSVEIPNTHSYALRLEAPVLEGRPLPVVVRVGDFGLGSHLIGDRLRVRVGPNMLETFEYHTWAAPLGSLIRDAVFGALLRGRVFADVVPYGERCEADWLLAGQVLAFELVEDDGGPGVWASLALSLRSEASGELLQREVHEHRFRCSTTEPGAAIAALEQALGLVLQDFLRNAEEREGRQTLPRRNDVQGPRAISRPPK